jgi:hypothetical protein
MNDAVTLVKDKIEYFLEKYTFLQTQPDCEGDGSIFYEI